ncbi:MAG: (Fe-S)-binding protein [Magnetococcales bacterium]|nr:(Fe-S)-binding protein [Magnetococcales bacterium]
MTESRGHSRADRETANTDPFVNATLCTHCGYCLPVCPTYQSDNDETHSPRGRVSIILALRAGALTAEEASETLSRCLLCRACHVACPAGVKPAKLVGHLRGRTGLAPLPLARWFHRITNHHARTARAAGWLARYQAWGLQKLVRRFRLLHRIGPLRRLEALLPEHRSDPIPTFPAPLPPARDPPPTRVALLCGCMARLFHPRTGPTTANLLALAGCTVIVPEGFGCCGAPYRESGDRKAFQKQAAATLEAFARQAADVDFVLCDSAICTVTVKGYARNLGHHPQLGQAAKELAAKVIDLATFLTPRLAQQGIVFGNPEGQTVAYHDHCQTRFGLGIIAEPRKLLDALPGERHELVPPGSIGACCGAGGEYMLRHPQQAQNVRAAKLETIAASDVDLVVASNAGCILHLEAGLREAGSRTKVRHLSETLWSAYLNRPINPREMP